MDQSGADDDRQLLEAFARQADQAAFAQIVDRHAPWVFAAALRQLKDRHLAEDAVQVVFIILTQKAHTMNARQKLSGWLFNTLNFTVKNFRRAEQSRRKHEAAAAHPMTMAPESAPSECAEEIDAAVARLPKAYRLIILLRFYRELSFDQIAQTLGTTEAAARKRVDRALFALRKHLGPTAATSSVVAASATFGRDQSPPLLGQNIARAVLASKCAGILSPVVSAGVKGVARMMTMIKAQTAALAAVMSLIVAVPAAIIACASARVALSTPAPREATVGGTVRNEAGQPLDGVRVRLRWIESIRGVNGSRQRWRTADLRTDINGRWEFSPIQMPNVSDLTIRLDHPDYVAETSALPQSGKLADQTAEFLMVHGVQVTGTVTDQTGKAIRGAAVSTIHTWYVVNDDGTKVTADRDGHFAFPPQKPGTITLTVTARGFGPEMQRVDVAVGMLPVKIVLGPGETIRARIVDGNGKPVEGATVRAELWRGMASLPWQGRTDRDGRFVVPDAPADAVEFTISKDGYQTLLGQDGASLTAGDRQATLTMPSQPTAEGTVVDADTGKPIPNFDVIPGYRLWAGNPPSFSFDRTEKSTGAHYKLTIDGHSEVADYYIRVEADGYAPAVTPPFHASGRFDLALHPSKNLHGRVVAADGSPLAKATVILALPGAQAEFFANKLLGSNEVRVAQTNAGGEFNFRAQSGRFHLLALCDSGCAMAVFDQQTTYPVELKISRWAKVVGTHPLGDSGDDPMELVAWVRPIQPQREFDVTYEWNYMLTTGSGGEFQLGKVPSFGGQPVQLGFSQSHLNTGPSERRWIPIRLSPGQTLTLDLTGATVVGSVGKSGSGPGGVWSSITLIPLMKQPAKNWPVDWSKDAELPAPLYKVQYHGAGSFRISGVRPGEYQYETWLNTKPPLRASGTVKVPPRDSDTTIDLGELKGEPVVPLKVGQTLPAVLGHMLDEAPIARHDFAGKFVLAVLWDNDGRESAAAMPVLTALGRQFSGNSRVALLGLNLDAIDNNGVPSRPDTLADSAWINGYVPQLDDRLNHELGSSFLPAVFILSPDGKLIARDVPVNEAGRILSQFLEGPRQPSTNPLPQ